MKRTKFFLAALLAVVLLLAVPMAALAEDPPEVEVSDVEVTGSGEVGTEVTASGTVTITVDAESNDFGVDNAYAESEAGYTVTGPDSTIIDSNGQYVDDFDQGIFGAEASASQTYEWSTSFTITDVGEYVIEHGGYAFYATWCSFFGFPYNYDSDYAGNSASVTIMGKRTPAPVPTWFDDGRFEIVIGGFQFSHKGYVWDGTTLPDEINQKGTANGRTVSVNIPAGTTVDGTDRMFITYNPFAGTDDDGDYYGAVVVELPKNATFSNPVTISVNGHEALTFTQIVNGVPQ